MNYVRDKTGVAHTSMMVCVCYWCPAPCWHAGTAGVLQAYRFVANVLSFSGSVIIVYTHISAVNVFRKVLL